MGGVLSEADIAESRNLLVMLQDWLFIKWVELVFPMSFIHYHARKVSSRQPTPKN